MKETEDRTAPGRKVILGLIGSPRKLGNCEVMVKEISRHTDFAHTLKLIRMPSLDIRPCNACYRCVLGKACPHEDDNMAPLLENLAHADGVIIASPVYFLGAHSIFKRILDRGFLLYDVLRETYGKPCILLNLYGMDERIGVAPHTLMTFASYLGLTIKANVNIKAALPGEALLSRSTLSQAKKLAKALSGRAVASRGPRCPFCGCTIVRLEKDHLVCTLCHGAFTLAPTGKTVPLREGGIFGDPEQMLLHRTWLSNMKDKFLKKRKEILKTTLPYKNMGEWVEP